MGFFRVSLLLARTVVGASLKPRELTLPAAISVPPSQSWSGNDGPWSSFAFHIGTPAQHVDVLISTASSETWVVVPEGCISRDHESTDCPTRRGGLFSANASSTWQPNNTYSLELESNLGYTGKGVYGFDTVGFGNGDREASALAHQVVAGVATKDFYLGLFGISPGLINSTNFSYPKQSFLAGLKQNGSVPSLSWGYTAGARYRLSKVFGSLTLGGYDIARFIPNNLSFPFGIGTDVTSRDLVVGIQSITTSSSGKPNIPLLPNPILALIDSTVPHLWLPKDACAKFESAFGLTWDDASELYLVNEELHESLVAQNASVTFKLGLTSKGGRSVDIVFPYAAFDLEVGRPLERQATKYFPLKRAANDKQYTLGRTFLQEAYLIVDYERLNFSVSQCTFTSPSEPNLVTILPPHNSTDPPLIPSSSSRLSMGAMAGIAIGAIALIGMFAFYFCVHKGYQYGQNLEDVLSGGNQGEHRKVEQVPPADHRRDTESDPRGSLGDQGMGPAMRRPVFEMSVVSTVPIGRPRPYLGQIQEGDENSRNNSM